MKYTPVQTDYDMNEKALEYKAQLYTLLLLAPIGGVVVDRLCLPEKASHEVPLQIAFHKAVYPIVFPLAY
jgi:hypothetical protein